MVVIWLLIFFVTSHGSYMAFDIFYTLLWNEATSLWERVGIKPHAEEITATAITALISARVASLTLETVANFSTTELVNLPVWQLTVLTKEHIAVLTTTQIVSFKTTQVQALTTTQVQSLQPIQINAFTPAQVAALTPEQLDIINRDTYTSTKNSRNIGEFPNSNNPGSTTIIL